MKNFDSMKELLISRSLQRESDIACHLPFLFLLASGEGIAQIVEFGVRTGNSTLALLLGLNEGGGENTTLYSYDINPPNVNVALKAFDGVDCTRWVFHQQDTADPNLKIPNCDLLFIDTLHTEAQVRAELCHHHMVRRWIILHDTVLFGEYGENGQPGINRAINEFLRNPYWTQRFLFQHNCGLTVLERINR